MHVDHVLLTLAFLQLLGSDLNLVSGLEVLLSPELVLNLLQVEELGRSLVSVRELVLEGLTVLLQLRVVSVLEGLNLAAVLILRLYQFRFPLFVELLVLRDVGPLTLLPLLLVDKDQLLLLPVELLFFELGDALLCHLSLNKALLLLAGLQVVLHRVTTTKRVLRSRW